MVYQQDFMPFSLSVIPIEASESLIERSERLQEDPPRRNFFFCVPSLALFCEMKVGGAVVGLRIRATTVTHG